MQSDHLLLRPQEGHGISLLLLSIACLCIEFELTRMRNELHHACLDAVVPDSAGPEVSAIYLSPMRSHHGMYEYLHVKLEDISVLNHLTAVTIV